MGRTMTVAVPGHNEDVQPSPGLVRGGVVAAIVAVVLGAAGATGWVVTLALPTLRSPDVRMSPAPQVTLAPSADVEPDPALVHTITTVLTVLLWIAATALVAYLVVWLVRRLRAAWRPGDETAEADQVDGGEVMGEAAQVDLESLATAVARAEAHLAHLSDPGDAVIAAWVALEDEAALQGTGRDPAQTPTEFTTALLDRTPAPADAVAALRGLYHRARFTFRPVTPDDVLAAGEALRRIAVALDAADRVTSLETPS